MATFNISKEKRDNLRHKIERLREVLCNLILQILKNLLHI